MSTATTTESIAGQQTSRRNITPVPSIPLSEPTTQPATQLERSAAKRLRTTMAAVKLSFTWLGVRNTPPTVHVAGRPKYPAYRAYAAVRSEASGYCRTVTLPFPEAGVRLRPQNSLGMFANTMQTYRERLQADSRGKPWDRDDHGRTGLGTAVHYPRDGAIRHQPSMEGEL